MGAAVATTINIKSIFFFFVLLNLSSASSSSNHHRHHRPSPAEFIRASCRSTRYPSLCVQSLASYAPSVRHSPCKLAHAALYVSANGARAASTFVGRLSSPPSGRSPRGSSRVRGGGGAIRDCLAALADSADSLRHSGSEMRRMGRRGTRRFRWHLGNVQTWVSAALTDEMTCLDSLSVEDSAAGSGTRAEIRNRILDAARLTSNALALVNRLQARN